MNQPYTLPSARIYDGLGQRGLPDEIQGWHSTHPVFAELISELDRSLPAGLELIAEVGSWRGASAIHMARTRLELSRRPFRIVCVDTWLGSLEHWLYRAEPGYAVPRDVHGYPVLYREFLENVAAAGLQDLISPVPLPSTTGALLLRRLGLAPQLVYLDASHEEADVRTDLEAWWPLVAPGGILFGDDIKLAGVRDGLAGFVRERPADLADLSVREDQFFILRKPPAPVACPAGKGGAA